MTETLTTFISCGPRPDDSHPNEWMLVGLVDDSTEREPD